MPVIRRLKHFHNPVPMRIMASRRHKLGSVAAATAQPHTDRASSGGAPRVSTTIARTTLYVNPIAENDCSVIVLFI